MFNCWLFQFFNSLCTNLPRRYVLPLDVKEDEPNDHNLINLPYTTATAVKTITGVWEQVKGGLRTIIFMNIKKRVFGKKNIFGNNRCS